MPLEPEISGLRRKAPLSSNSSFSSTFQDGIIPGASWRVKHTHPAGQSIAWGHSYLQKGCWSAPLPRPWRCGTLGCSPHHMLDHRQENLASAWPGTAESRYAFSPVPTPSSDKRSFTPKGTCPHWLWVTLIQLLGCTPGQEPKPLLAGLQATAIWRGRNNSAVKELINQAESCLAALNFPSAICYIFYTCQAI